MSKKKPKAIETTKENIRIRIYTPLIAEAAISGAAIITGLFGLLPKNPQSILEITSLTATD